MRYVHDVDGNLTEKHTPEGTWRYGWNGAGLLSEVERPDGARVRLSYDALARRTGKRVVQGAGGMESSRCEVRFIWDGDVPLHEVVSSKEVTTWLFEPESFSPLAKEDSTGRYSLVTDHLGAPTEMYDELGHLAWKMQLDAFGVGKADVALGHCPWRWPGQYEDAETGLLYNRFRYYDAEVGRYISQDPLGLGAGPSLYGYPDEPFSTTDPLGLAGCNLNSNTAKSNFGIYKIWINEVLHKIGKADLNRVTKSSDLPTRLHQQLRKLGEKFGTENVRGEVVKDLGKVTTGEAKSVETSMLQSVFEKTKTVPLGNQKSFKPKL
jgi:RHS repeat-associated protein